MDLGKEPNPPFPVEIIDTKPVEVKNPFSGEKVMLQPTAVAVYDSRNTIQKNTWCYWTDDYIRTFRTGH